MILVCLSAAAIESGSVKRAARNAIKIKIVAQKISAKAKSLWTKRSVKNAIIKLKITFKKL